MSEEKDPIIKLNVGGKKFETRKSTLTKCAYFESLLERWNDDNKQEFFVDRNPKRFEIVLDMLRGTNPEIWTDAVNAEFEFFGVKTDEPHINVSPWIFPEEWRRIDLVDMMNLSVFDHKILVHKCYHGRNDIRYYFGDIYSCKGLTLYMDIWSQEHNRLLSHDEILEFHVLREIRLNVELCMNSIVFDRLNPYDMELEELFRPNRVPNIHTGLKIRLPLMVTEHNGKRFNLIKEGAYGRDSFIDIQLSYIRHNTWSFIEIPTIVAEVSQTTSFHDEIEEMMKKPTHWKPSLDQSEIKIKGLIPFFQNTQIRGGFNFRSDHYYNTVTDCWSFRLNSLSGVTSRLIVWFEDIDNKKYEISFLCIKLNNDYVKRTTDKELFDQMTIHEGIRIKEPVYSLLNSGQTINFSVIDNTEIHVRFKEFPTSSKRPPVTLYYSQQTKNVMTYTSDGPCLLKFSR